jgi:hypothetical protein
MTETTTIPFDAQQAPAPTGPQFEAEPAGNRNKLLALAGGAGVLVLAVAGYFLLFAGGDSGPAGTPAVVPTHAVPAPSASAPAAPAKPAKISTKSFGHDPFKPLIAAAAGSTSAGSTGTAPTGTAVTTQTAGGTTTTTTTGDSSGATSDGTTGGTTTPTVTADHAFRVVRVANDGKHLRVRVDGVEYRHLAAGEVFATFFKVVVIGGKVNGFQFGDEKFSVFGTKKLYIAS